MSSTFTIFIVSLLSLTSTAGLAAKVDESATVRNIHGTLPSDGVPPFAGVALVILAASIGLTASRSSRKTNRTTEKLQTPGPPDNTLEHLRDAYERGELSADRLFAQLAVHIGEALYPDYTTAMTSNELLAATGTTLPSGPHGQAAALLALCDRVRFGGYRPDKETVTQAISAAHKLLEQLRSLT